MSQDAPALNPADFGLPARAQFRELRIWDSYYLPRATPKAGALAAETAADLRELAPFALERICGQFHVGLGTLLANGARSPAEEEAPLRALLAGRDQPLLGFMYVNPRDVAGTLAAMDRWIRGGPMVGISFKGSQPGLLVCSHPNLDPIVRRAADLGAAIMVHTWWKTSGKDDPDGSTPPELVELARRNPKINLICAHAGGDWERGLRAIRPYPNVLIETSGFNPTAGFIDMAVRELGAERILFGGHFMSRSVGTEFGKILGAGISEEARRLIFGGNLRRLLGPILRK